MGFFLRKIAYTASRNDTHAWWHAAFLLHLPRKGCAYHYTPVLALDHCAILEDILHCPTLADAHLIHRAVPQRLVEAPYQTMRPQCFLDRP